MPVQGTTWSPVSTATERMNSTSRPRNIAVGSQIERTPSSTAALAASTAASRSPPGPISRSGMPPLLGASGHWACTASSWVRRCSWISVSPRSPASIGPVTVSIVAIARRSLCGARS